jgi:hypothetical protein
MLLPKERKGGRGSTHRLLGAIYLFNSADFTKKLNNRDSKTVHMVKAYVPVLSTIALVVAAVFVVPSIQVANAQYTGGGNVEEQLKLAREKTSLAAQQGAYGSGTSMLSATLDSSILFIIILVVIFGGVAGMFFLRSRGARKAATTYDTHEKEPDWKKEAQRYKDQLEALQRENKDR